DAEEEHQVAGVTRARSLRHLSAALARPRRDKEIAERMRGQRTRRHHGQSKKPRQTATHPREPYAHRLDPVRRPRRSHAWPTRRGELQEGGEWLAASLVNPDSSPNARRQIVCGRLET